MRGYKGDPIFGTGTPIGMIDLLHKAVANPLPPLLTPASPLPVISKLA